MISMVTHKRNCNNGQGAAVIRRGSRHNPPTKGRQTIGGAGTRLIAPSGSLARPALGVVLEGGRQDESVPRRRCICRSRSRHAPRSSSSLGSAETMSRRIVTGSFGPTDRCNFALVALRLIGESMSVVKLVRQV